MNLKHLTDKVLLLDTKRLAAREREISVEVLNHFKEIERRRLFSDLGYGSMFDYAVKELGYSGASASRRIQAARLIKDMPFLEKKISDGSITLSNLAMAGNLFKSEGISNPEIKKEILQKIENVSSRDCGKTLLDFQTTPVIPKETVVESAPNVTTVKFNLSSETIDLLNELRNVLAHHRFGNDELLKRVFKTALEEIIGKKFKTNAKFSAASASRALAATYLQLLKNRFMSGTKAGALNAEAPTSLSMITLNHLLMVDTRR